MAKDPATKLEEQQSELVGWEFVSSDDEDNEPAEQSQQQPFPVQQVRIFI